MSRSTDAEFLEAASTGQSHIVTSMLADLSAEEKQRIMLVTTAQGHTALHAAAFGGHASVVNVLLAATDYLLFAELMLGSTEKRDYFLYILNGLQADVQRSLG